MAIIETDRDLATILAALRYWQREGLMSAGRESDIATDGGRFAPLSADEIDSLCERLNFSEPAADSPDEPWGAQIGRQLEAERQAQPKGKFAFAPTGAEIIGTLERLSGRADVVPDSYRHTESGSLEFDWEGGTDIFWDDQQTETIDGARQFLDRDGGQWSEDELVLLDHEDATDEDRARLFGKASDTEVS